MIMAEKKREKKRGEERRGTERRGEQDATTGHLSVRLPTKDKEESLW